MTIGKVVLESSSAHLTPALKDSANLMQKTPFYFKLKFQVAALKKLREQGIL